MWNGSQKREIKKKAMTCPQSGTFSRLRKMKDFRSFKIFSPPMLVLDGSEFATISLVFFNKMRNQNQLSKKKKKRKNRIKKRV
jgi:hypothetical protein